MAFHKAKVEGDDVKENKKVTLLQAVCDQKNGDKIALRRNMINKKEIKGVYHKRRK